MEEIIKLFGNTENMWQYITQYASRAGRAATRTVLQLFYVVKSPNTPMLDKTLIVAALAYQLLPEDLMSRDRFGLFGLLDNAVSIGVAYNRVKARVTPEIENQVEALLNQWFEPESEGTPGDDDSSIRWIEQSKEPESGWNSNPQSDRVPINRPVFNQHDNHSNSSNHSNLAYDDVIID